MKKYNLTEKLAFEVKQKAEEKKSANKGFEVIHCGKAVYESTSWALCNGYIIRNTLQGAKIKALQ